MNEIYISLDLETTGFDAETDQVIEIAAIKFQGNKILEEFETLINPMIEIPAMVSHITGIDSDTVRDAPTFESIAPGLRAFLGNHPIVGHNIDFDLTFLESKGIPILNKQYDTLQLAGILLPNLPSYSLDTISRQLKIDHKNKHRAMSDAHVCFELFQILTAKIQEIPKKTLKEIQTQIAKAHWDLGELFINISTPPAGKKVVQVDDNADKPALKIKLDSSEDLLNLFDLPSPLSELVNNFEARPSQKKLLDHILQAFQRDHHLLAEAGTGTGKTLAYLLASAHHSSKSHEKIIISTYTHNLQDQIIYKDFPLVQRLFPNIRISLLKGRKKYLSLQRFEQLKQRSTLESHELIAIIKILIWLDTTTTGDLDELHLQNKENIIIDDICSLPDQKPGSSGFEEFLDRARRSAETADIVVVNHALLIQDALADNKILPQSEFLIVDEAHHLEKTTTDALTITISYSRFLKQWESLLGSIEDARRDSLAFDNELTQLTENFATLKIKSLHQVERLFDNIREMLNQFAKILPGIPVQLSINIALRNSEEWQTILAMLKDLKPLRAELQNMFQKFQNILDSSEIEDSETPNHFNNLIDSYLEAEQIAEQYDRKINWISKGFLDESIHFHAAPLQITDSLKTLLFNFKKSVILTSATLTSFGNFNYIRSELGLGEDFNEIKLPSHFSYPDQVKIIIPEDLPEPKEPEYIEECQKVIDEVIIRNGGRALVLFTAKRELAKVFHDLAPKLKKVGINLLAQGLTGGRGKIISHFQDEPASCAILGTNSFWEGVDLIGPVLTCVIIQKLPFDPPDDPIVQARSAKFRRPFDEYSLPRAILRFKQGFGRLIRSARDTGSVVILDSRLVQKAYGRDFIASLPEGIQIKQCPKSEVQDYI